jgi:hypothetical protein
MSFDARIGIAGLVIGIIGVGFAFFSVTSERFRDFLIRRGISRVPSAFAALAREYRVANDIPDDPPGPVTRPTSDTRVRKKNILAEGLGRFAQGLRLDREILVAADDDGYIVALMKLIANEPRRGDAFLIARASKRRVPTHTDYATMEAIGVLAEKGLIDLQERGQIADALDQLVARLDDTGKTKIASLRTKVNKAPE